MGREDAPSYSYCDWPPYEPKGNGDPGQMVPEGVWPFFRWSTPELPLLEDTLRTELAGRLERFQAEKERYPNDADERTIDGDWWSERHWALQRWCDLLEIGKHDFLDIRQGGWVEEKKNQLIVARVFSLVRNLSSSDVAFRPRCLDKANSEIMKWLESHPGDVDRVHHRTFEGIVAEMIAGAGWTVELTKRTRDGGYDILCLRNSKLGVPVSMLVETKLYKLERSAGLAAVDRLMGVAVREHADKVVLVTNSRISRDSWKRWEHNVGRDLELIDREELLEWLRDGKSRLSRPVAPDCD